MIRTFTAVIFASVALAAHAQQWPTKSVRFVVPFEAVWNVVVEKGSHREPLDVNAQCGVLAPNSTVRSSLAVDAPDHVRLADASEQDLSSEINLAGKSEG